MLPFPFLFLSFSSTSSRIYPSTYRNLGARRMKHAFQLTGIPCQVAFLIALPCFSALLDRWALELRSLHGAGRGAALEIVAELLNIAAKELCVPIAVGLAGIFSGIRRDLELSRYTILIYFDDSYMCDFGNYPYDHIGKQSPINQYWWKIFIRRKP